MGYTDLTQDHHQPLPDAQATDTAKERQVLLVEQSPIGVIEWDTEGRVISWNRASEQIFGYPAEEAIGQRGVDLLLFPEDQGRFHHVWNRLIEHPGMIQGRNTNRRKDGRAIICEWYNSVLHDLEGRVTRVASLCIDITEQIQAEQAQRKSEEEYRALAENFPDIITRFDAQGRVIYVNQAIEREMGIPASTLVGKTFQEVAPTVDLMETFDRYVRQIFETGQDVEFEAILLTRNGPKDYLARGVPEFDPDGQVGTVLFIHHNITERKQNEAVLRERAEFEKLLTDLLAEIICADWPQMPEVIRGVMRRIADLLNVDRVALYDFAIDQNHSDVILEYVRRDIPGRIQSIDRFSFPWFFEQMERGQTIAISEVRDLPPEASDLRVLLEAIGQESYLCVPVIAGRLVRGAIGLATYQRPHSWSPDLVARMRVVAELLVNGLARAQAEEAEHNQRVLAEALRDSAAMLNSNLDLNLVFDNILDAVNRVVSSDTADIQILDAEGYTQIVREKGYPNRNIGIDIHTWRYHCRDLPPLATMLDTHQPILISDTRHSHLWNSLPETQWIQSYAGAPMISRGQVIGFVNLGSTVPGFFCPEHVERLRAFVDQAAIAFTNARLVEQLRQVNEQMQAQLDSIQVLQKELREQAIRDPLTGLFNRRYLQESLEREIARARQERLSIGLIEMDIDHFKQVNDTCGHPAGDQMLRALARLLESQVRQADLVSRYGGEEFVIVLPGASLELAEQRAEQIRQAVEDMHVTIGEQTLQVTVSVGVSAYPKHGLSADQVLLCADQALYRAKETGRNRVTVFEAR